MMDVRYLPDQESYKRMTTAELRKAFLLEHLFVPGEAHMTYCDTDRAIVGGAVPLDGAIALEASRKEMAAEYFAERREVGIVNIGGTGNIIADGHDVPLAAKEMLYVGRGTRKVVFTSARASDPAVFYFVSFPAHASYPTTRISLPQSESTTIGSIGNANKRTIHRYIHPAGMKSCQLVMGLTELDSGSVWNTMPSHAHQRRMEVYLYCGLDPDSLVIHLMGKPHETRSLIVRNRQGVVSPSWSIHSGAATRNYYFIWAMGGENQEFSDMDNVTMQELY